MIRHKLLVAVAIIFVIVGCTRKSVYNEFIAMPPQGWNMDSLAVFRVEVTKPDVPHNLFIQVRNESRYPNSNLWLFIDVVSPDGHLQRDTLECQLADINGRWLGDGWGTLYTLQCPYRMNTKFATGGTYVFRVAHGMRHEDLQGITNIGLRVEKKY